MNGLRRLFPKTSPYNDGMLDVNDLHSIYWEESGNPSGVPVVVLHGGPGGGSHPDLRRFFDPAIFRIVMFDQRGCGKSTPLAEIKENTTADLTSDIEKLKKLLNIDNWHIFGGSWGSTLALAYAQSYPDSCLSLTIRGIFLMRQQEVDWFLNDMKNIFPEVWDSFANHLPTHERDNILENYYKRLTNSDPTIHIPAAQYWSAYESSFDCLRAKPVLPEDQEPKLAVAIARIEAHYFKNCMFEPDDKLLRNLPKIHHIPCNIVQGRYDIACPVTTAWEVHKNYPKSKYYIIDDAGHSSMEAGITDRLIRCMEELLS